MIFPRQLREEGVGSGFKVGVMRKKAVIFSNIDVPKLARPNVNIAEKVTVDSAQVGEIKVSLDGLQGEFIGTGSGIVRFALLQNSGIADTELVLENAGFGIKVAVGVGILYGHRDAVAQCS